jgi:hypothetical protein
MTTQRRRARCASQRYANPKKTGGYPRPPGILKKRLQAIEKQRLGVEIVAARACNRMKRMDLPQRHRVAESEKAGKWDVGKKL